MRIVNAKQIHAKKDWCTITRGADGAINVGSIRIEPDEIDEYVEHLRHALAQVAEAPVAIFSDKGQP